MIRFRLVVCLSLGVFASSAFGADYAVKGSLSQILQGSNNEFLLNSPAGTTYESLTAGTLNFLARTLDTRVLFDANFSYFDYFGSGASQTSPTSGTPAAMAFRVDHSTELDRYNFAASWQRSDLATTQLTESGLVTGQGFIDTYQVGGGITHDLSRTDSIGLHVNEGAVRYTQSAQTPYNDLATVLSWNHEIDPRTALTTFASLDWFDADDPANSQRLFWQLVTSLHTQISSRLSLSGSIGASYSNTFQRNSSPTISPGSFYFQPGIQSGVQAYVGLNYQLFRDTSLSFTAGEGLVPTSYGALQQISTVGMVLAHNIDAFSSVSFAMQFAHNDIVGNPQDLFSAQIAYAYRLTREWGTNVSYTYRLRNDTTGTADSSTILFALRYDFNVIGNPTAYDEHNAEVERARQRQRAVQAFPGLL